MEDSDLAPHTTLNVPQLIVLLVLALLALRWLLSGNNRSSSRASGSDAGLQQQRGQAGSRGAGGGGGVASRGAGPRANPRHVETLAQMFPQVPARDIVWDLQRNGNNVQLTTERILSGRGLETPPPSFQPVIPQAAMPAAGSATGASAALKQTGPDLIQRYNLAGRIAESGEAASASEAAKATWSTNKTERQISLQKRREEMILAARRKMLEKV